MNPVFEHYMTEQAQQALNVFRTFNKEDFIDEFIDFYKSNINMEQ